MKRGVIFGLALLPVVFGVLHQMGSTKNESPTPQQSEVSCDRIISLAPSLTESLFAVGLGNQVVGVTRYCAYPEQVSAIPKIGGYADPNLSAIAALNPTLVVMLDEHMETRKKINALGISALSVSQHQVKNILNTMTTLGRTCHVEPSADNVVTRLKQRMQQISTAIKDLPRPSVMISMGRNMGSGELKDAYIAGEESYYQDLIQLAGGKNAYSGKVPFPIVSKEGMLGLNPDVIIDMVPDLTEKGWTEEMIKKEWESLPVKAAINQRIHVFTAAYSVVPGPRFILTLEEMAQVLHPEINWESL